MGQRFAFFVSALFHPVFVNLLNLFMLFTFFPALSHGVPAKLRLYYMGYVFITTSIVPMVVVFSLRLTGKIKSLSIEEKEERRLPYLITFLMYVFNYYNLSKYSVPPLLLSYLFSGAAIMLTIVMINYFYKISIHATTMGSGAAILASAAFHDSFDTRLVLLLFVLVSGLVCSARLFMKSHDEAQIYLGYLLGSIFMFILL
jgi:hypothetical protein